MLSNKIGSYAHANIEIQNWLSTPIQNQKVKRTKKVKEQESSIFTFLAELSKDKSWKHLLTNAAKGKFPSGFTYNGSCLMYKKKSKTDKLDLLKADAKTLNDVMDFFTRYGGYVNPEDQINIFEYISSNVEDYTCWSQIRGKKKKDYFLSRYIRDLTKEYQLNKQEMLQLHDLLFIGCSVKSIDQCNIELEDMKIKHINNLIWNESTRTFSIDGVPKIKKSTRKKVGLDRVPKDSYLYSWYKFISKLTSQVDLIENMDITDTFLTTENISAVSSAV
jgi:hypothetical protein